MNEEFLTCIHVIRYVKNACFASKIKIFTLLFSFENVLHFIRINDLIYCWLFLILYRLQNSSSFGVYRLEQFRLTCQYVGEFFVNCGSIKWAQQSAYRLLFYSQNTKLQIIFSLGFVRLLLSWLIYTSNFWRHLCTVSQMMLTWWTSSWWTEHKNELWAVQTLFF